MLNWFHQVFAMAMRFFLCPVSKLATPDELKCIQCEHPCPRYFTVTRKEATTNITPPITYTPITNNPNLLLEMLQGKNWGDACPNSHSSDLETQPFMNVGCTHQAVSDEVLWMWSGTTHALLDWFSLGHYQDRKFQISLSYLFEFLSISLSIY